jgi:hypothetical protein
MVIILWIVVILIRLVLFGLVFVFLLWVGGGSICWPWESCVEDIRVYANPAVNEGGNTTDINRAVQTGILAGAVLIRSYREDQRGVDRLTRGMELAKESGISDNVKRSEQALEDGIKRKDITFEIYADQLKRSAEYSMQQNSEQLDALKKQFKIGILNRWNASLSFM